jgi:hypothetical protein
MKKAYLFLTIAIITLLAVLILFFYGKEPESIRPKSYGLSKYDSIRSIVPAFDGGYLMAGMTSSYGAGYIDAYLLKVDKYGNKQWENSFGGKGDDRIYDIKKTDGGYVLAGYSSSSGDGREDFYLLGVNKKGDLKFSRTYSGSGNGQAKSIEISGDGGYIMAGTLYSADKISRPSMYVIKTDAEGNCVWARTIGGARADNANCIIKAIDSGYVITGDTTSYGSGMQDIVLIKIDSRGNTIWMRTFGGKNPDYGSMVVQTADNGYAIIGSTSSFGAGNLDCYLIKTDSRGNSVWSKTYGGQGVDQGVSIITTADKGYIIGGTSESFSYGSSDLLLLKVDASGNTLWTKHFGGKADDYLGGITLSPDGGCAAAGWTKATGEENYDAYFLKVKGNGEF